MLQHTQTLKTLKLKKVVTHKKKHVVSVHLCKMSRTDKSVNKESRWVVTRDWGLGIDCQWAQGFLGGGCKCSGSNDSHPTLKTYEKPVDCIL